MIAALFNYATALPAELDLDIWHAAAIGLAHPLRILLYGRPTLGRSWGVTRGGVVPAKRWENLGQLRLRYAESLALAWARRRER